MKTGSKQNLSVLCCQSPKPTSKEWKPVATYTTSLKFSRSEAYLEGMKTWDINLIMVACIWVRSLPRRNENVLYVDLMGCISTCPKPTSKEWKLPFILPVYSLPNRSEAYLEGMKTMVHRNLFHIHSPSEAYLEGMKTARPRERPPFFHLRSEAYLEGMKTMNVWTHVHIINCPKPTSKEWKHHFAIERFFCHFIVRSLPRRNENFKLILIPFICRSSPKPTSKEWKQYTW